MKALQSLALLTALGGTTALASASDLNVTIQSAGSSIIDVTPGALINYTVTAELSDAANQGLAMFAFDLVYDGGSLTPVSAGGSMGPFVAPMGLNNPAGFGGTMDSGNLLQVGGAQNTINNSFAPQPSGTVATGIGMPGAPVVVASGMLTAPAANGIYTLSVENLFANAINLNADGIPFWIVDAVAPGTLGDLVIQVSDCNGQVVCAGKPNSQACVPTVSFSGQASFSGTDTLLIDYDMVINREFGALIWDTDFGPTSVFGTMLCVGPNYRIMLFPGNSGGSGTPNSNCTGSYQFEIDQTLLSTSGLFPGTTVYAQCIYRDPFATTTATVGVTPAISFVVCP